MAFEYTRLTQPDIASQLEENIAEGRLPQSILFSGQPGSSRLTAALDLAFTIAGGNRETLSSQNIIYFPHRNLVNRVKTALNLLISDRNRKSILFFVETMRLINMQYNSAVSKSAGPAAQRYYESARETDYLLSEIEDMNGIGEKEIKELRALRDITNEKYLYFGRSSPSPVTIDQLRLVKEWMNSGNGEKVVIIEDIESAAEGAKNSILKMLEEPLEHFTIILISSQSSRIMETILSRVRKFSFPSLGEKTVSSLVSSRFSRYGEYSSFDSFFFCEANTEEDVGKCEAAIRDFLLFILGERKFDAGTEEELNALLSKLNAYTYFRTRLVSEAENMYRKGRLDAYSAKRILGLLLSWNESVDIYNMNEKSGLDYIIREICFVKQIT